MIVFDKVNKFVCVSICVFVLSCNGQNSEPKVLIRKNADTISTGEVFEANLFLSYKDSMRLADFYIVQNEDTFLLNYNACEKYAVFKATTSSVGKKRYVGFSEFQNEEGITFSNSFIIEFYSD